MGLFDNRNEGILAFEELLNFSAPPAQLRWIFALSDVEGCPALTIWEAHEGSLSADIRDSLLRTTSSPSPDLIRNEVLLALQSILRGLGKSLADIGLPEPVERQQEIDAERLRWSGDPSNLCSFKDGLIPEQVKIYPHNSVKFTYFQHTVYDRIMEMTTMDNPRPIHIDGRAGRGKTYVLYPIIGALRKMDEIILLSASSAFAAKNYPGGRTTHYLYGIPVD
jgi:hypothetical protein